MSDYLLNRSGLVSPHVTLSIVLLRTLSGDVGLEVGWTSTYGPTPGAHEADHGTAGLGKWLIALVVLGLNVVIAVCGLVLGVCWHHSRPLGGISAARHGSKLKY